jgi:hypothetical protein
MTERKKENTLLDDLKKWKKILGDKRGS